MRADQVEVSWDAGKARWLIRIVNGEEVIRRYCNMPKDTDEQALGAAAQKTVQDEGYEPMPHWYECADRMGYRGQGRGLGRES